MTESMNSLKILRVMLVVLTLASACNNTEIGNAKDVNPETIYFDYSIKALEEGGDVAVRLQYRFGGEQGTTLLLEEPSRVTFDGQPVSADSSRTEGAYYEVVKPFNEFAGPHTIVYTASNGKKYEETVQFPVFSLTGAVPDTIGREQLAISVEGLKAGDHIQLMLTDTAAYSEGIDRIDSLKSGKIVIKAAELAGLKEGPVNFQIIRQRYLPLRQTTKEGGRLYVSYSVSRGLYLR